MSENNPQLCDCGSGEPREAEYDAQGIFIFYCCSKCKEEKWSHYRSCIRTGYTQADVDEPIEED